MLKELHLVVLDNYDSFTYNLVHMLYALGARLTVLRNRETTPREVLSLKPDAILLSPGPSRPEKAGIMPSLIDLAVGKVPMLGVCLGHQALAQHFGAKIVSAQRIMHGKVSLIEHDGKGLFAGMKSAFKAVRYHSLAVDRDSVPAELEVTCRAEDGEIMGLRHKEYLIEGIQYHPESILTINGKTQIGNFLKMVRAAQPKPF